MTMARDRNLRIYPLQTRRAVSVASMTLIPVALLIAARFQAAGDTSEPVRGRFKGRIVRDFAAPADDPMLLPSDVAVASDGRVYVADGTHDRIVCFDPVTGRVAHILSGPSDDALSRPLGVFTDGEGRVWVADTGRGRIVAFDASGRMEIAHAVAGITGSDTVDLTDMVLTADGRAILTVDNHHHRIIRIERSSGLVSTFGRWGSAMGQFDHPFLIASDHRGRIFLSDVINGRVVAVSEDGSTFTLIGSFGVSPGHMFRPKGVACDAQGRIWISDGVMGVIQVFAPQGRLIDVLRGADGEPLRFAAPVGMSFGPDGNLYVVESTASRVVQLRIEEDHAAPSSSAPPVSPGRQPHACAVCHIEWVAPLVEGRRTDIMAVPDNPPEYPLVSRPESCLSCHDGSVSDSRRRVWVEHGHRSGVAPPAGMTVPAMLPLAEGQIVCRTCHSAHTRGGSGNTMKDAVFLRVSNEANQLCVTCHADMSTGTMDGMHPLICAPPASPRGEAHSGSGERAGAQRDDPPVTDCLTCHSPHGSGRDALLKTPFEPDALCLKCHADVIQGPPDARTHPVSGSLRPQQTAALLDLGGHPRWSASLGCLSCHTMHRAPSPDGLLRVSTTNGDLCLTCHGEKISVLATAHDPRLFREDAAGPCGACHTTHPSTLKTSPAPSYEGTDANRECKNDAFARADHTGACGTCHRAEGFAEQRTGRPFSHPNVVESSFLKLLRDRFAGTDLRDVSASGEADRRSIHAALPPDSLTCGDCHDPHRADHGHFLRAAPDDLCVICHTAQGDLKSGPHDFLSDPGQVNRAGLTAAESGRCGACHAVHQAEGPALWAATRDSPTSAEDACLACHRAGGPAENTIPRKLLHPMTRAATSENRLSPLPLFNDLGRRTCDGNLSCATCHDPHAPAADSSMLRRTDGGDRTTLCAACHAQAETLSASPHDPRTWEQHGATNGSCAPCHAVHAPKDGDGLPWVGLGVLTDADEPASLPGAQSCLTCHRADGMTGRGIRAVHPQIFMTSAAYTSDDQSLPLIDEQGRLGSRGYLTCQTCHMPHGNLMPHDAEVLRALDPSGAVLRASRPMLRAYRAPNLCTQCHGFDGLERFLRFHRFHDDALPAVPARQMGAAAR